MTALEQFVSPALVRALGWTLLHSLWQGALVAAVLAGALLLLRRQRAEVRYAASAGALGAVMALAGITFGLYFTAGADTAAAPQTSAAGVRQVVSGTTKIPAGSATTTWAVAAARQPTSRHEAAQAAVGASAMVVAPASRDTYAVPAAFTRALQTGLRYFDNQLPLLVVAWLLGLLAMSLRLLGGLLYVQRLRRYRVQPLAAVWQVRLAGLAARAGLRRPVALLESALVRVPLVVGHVRPVILLPLGAVAGLPPAYLEAILAHELAHVLRRDYLVNLLQTVAEAVFFYHPAVWFVAGCVRSERENCCDDTATVLVDGDPLRLACALTALAEWSQSAVVTAPAPRLALAALGRRGALLGRVRRLVQRRPAAPTLAEGLLAGALVLGGLGLLGGSVALAGPLAQATLPAVRRLVRPVLAPGFGPDRQQPQPIGATPTAADTSRGTRPADPGTAVITRDKKGRLTGLVVNGQSVAVPTDKPSKAERRAGRRVTVVPVPESLPGRPEYAYRATDQTGRDTDWEGRRLDDHARDLDRAGRELDKAGRKLDKMGREMDQEARKMDRKSGPYPFDRRRRTGDISSEVHIDIDDAALNQLVTNALKLGNVGLNIGLQAASLGLDEARRALETTLRDPSLSDEARRATREALTELRQEERHSQRPGADRAQEARDRRQELQDRIRESEQELRDLDQDRADPGRDRADQGRDRADQDRERNEALLNQMAKDGLLKDPGHYQIKLTARALVIDGREQPASVHQKYLKLHEGSTGRKLTGNNAMVVTRSSDSSTIINGVGGGDGPAPPRPPRMPRAPRLAPLAPLPAPPAPPAPPRVDTETLRDELRKDGVIGRDDKNLQFQLNAAGLTVNGKKQSEELAAKYRKLTYHDNDKSFNMTISTQE